MIKRIILAGVLGWITLMAVVFVANGIFGFYSRIAMKRVPDEPRVYALLKETITEPGRYICNPAVTPEAGFPAGEPVFSIAYGGVGHEAAGWLMQVRLMCGLAAMLLAAWLLSLAAPRVLASYGRRVLFLGALGLLIAVFKTLPEAGIGSFPPQDALRLAGFDFVTWLVAALAAAWPIRPLPASAPLP